MVFQEKRPEDVRRVAKKDKESIDDGYRDLSDILAMDPAYIYGTP